MHRLRPITASPYSHRRASKKITRPSCDGSQICQGPSSSARPATWPCASLTTRSRSIKYQITIAKLPLAKDVADFAFDGTPINEALVRDLAGGNFLAHQLIKKLEASVEALRGRAASNYGQELGGTGG